MPRLTLALDPVLHPALWVALLVVMGSLVGAATASAQRAGERDAGAADTEAARELFLRGREHYDHGRYEQASEAFEAAYELTHSSELLYNIYTSTQRQGDLVRAASALSQYLAESEVDPEERAQLEARLVRLEDEAETQRREREAQAAEAAEAQRRLEEAEARAQARGPRVSTPATVALITGGAGVVVFSVFAGLAFREDNALADRCGSGAGRVCTGAQVRRLRAYNATADAGLAIGAAGLVTGLTLYFLQRDNGHEGEEGGSTEARAQSRATLRVAPSLDASSAGLVLMGTY